MEQWKSKVESMVEPYEIFRGRKILITGHTGFKGSWLTLWLNKIGAEIAGLSLDPVNRDDAFNVMRLTELCDDFRQDINDFKKVLAIMESVKPEIIFHLAAQPIVLEARKDPLYTFNTNIIGTANLLEAGRQIKKVKAVIVITTDKVYENTNSGKAFSEADRLGGRDIYGASKSAAEMIAGAYRNTFCETGYYAIATARAGNVIGGGDWSAHRIIPDCVRALTNDIPIKLRNPGSVRPWQHVLEPLGGYLQLAAKILTEPDKFSESWNFGPDYKENRTVLELTEQFIKNWGQGKLCINSKNNDTYEARLLAIDSKKAFDRLGWKSKISFEDTVGMTAQWYKAQVSGADMREFSLHQISQYEEYASC